MNNLLRIKNNVMNILSHNMINTENNIMDGGAIIIRLNKKFNVDLLVLYQIIIIHFIK